MATFTSLLLRIQTELSLLGGIDVQTYAEPKLAAKLQRVFNEVFDRRFWKDYRKYKTFTVNGIDGVPIGFDATDITRFSDIEYIWHSDFTAPLCEASNRVNPALITMMSYCADASQVAKFRILPMNEEGTFSISYRSRPVDFIDDDEVPFDEDYLVLETVAEYLIDEGANLPAAQDRQRKAQQRLQTLYDNETRHDKSTSSHTAAYLTEWR